MIESLKNPVSTVHVEDFQSANISKDFQSKIEKRLQGLALSDISRTQKVDSKVITKPPIISRQLQSEDITPEIGTESLPVRVTVSPNHFSMKGPWLEHALAFHSLKTKGSTLMGTANKFEFQSSTPIEDAIKVVTACSSQTDLYNFLYSKKGRRAKKRKNASVPVNFGNRIPTPIPEHRTVTSLKSEKPLIGKAN